MATTMFLPHSDEEEQLVSSSLDEEEKQSVVPLRIAALSALAAAAWFGSMAWLRSSGGDQAAASTQPRELVMHLTQECRNQMNDVWGDYAKAYGNMSIACDG